MTRGQELERVRDYRDGNEKINQLTRQYPGIAYIVAQAIKEDYEAGRSAEMDIELSLMLGCPHNVPMNADTALAHYCMANRKASQQIYGYSIPPVPKMH